MPDEKQELSTRRSIIAKGGALLGMGLLAGAAIPAKAQTVTVNSTEPIDVRKFGASGKRTENATKAFGMHLKQQPPKAAER
jgi:hypothetical protein